MSNKKTIPQSASEINQSLGLEADYPIPLAQRKRNPEQWRKNVKRKKQRSGESYDMNTKQKKVKLK